ncbi:DUF3352 domain-containing protein [Jiangella rhizosphaerae]|uniref:DUF3352 domain-containing protein n=1 Tax=Jiangella rhizosphaerae TaxID=2293569 RepID=A0A418KIR5_9ACTN|nr:DUF3352 domain-containing protein [Jiangella rhizosphaerae]RIQ12954.1 DUF3352 domain-containing protein [Jiangella rhizosphaerae]
MSYPGSPTGPGRPEPQQGSGGPLPPVPPPPPSTPFSSAPDPATQPLAYPGGATPEPAIVPRKRRGLLAGGIAAAVLLVVPGAVFAWQALDGGGTQPHDVLPADAIGYVRLDLDPSAGQKIEAFRFLQNFPLFTEATGITDEDVDLRERFVDELASATGCDISFADDVEPWVGERVGAAITPPSGDSGEPGYVVALQASDEEAATAAIDRILGCGGGEAEADGLGRAYVDGYLLVTDTQENADAYAAGVAEASLADNAEFTQAMDLLGEQGVASAWFSGSAMFATFDGSAASFGIGAGASGNDLPSLDEARELIDETYRSVALSVRFDDRYAELAGVVTGSSYHALEGGGVDASVPDDTTLFLGSHDAGQYLRDTWDASLESVPDGAEMLAELEAQTGLVLPDDLATVLGEELVVAADAGDLDAEAFEYGDFSSIDLGARVVTDPDAFADLWQRIQGLAADAGAPLDELPLQTTDDGYVLATSEDYAAQLLEGGGLADTDAYRTAVADADDADSAFFVNVDTVEQHILDAAGGSLGEDETRSIEALQAIGMAMHLADGHMELSLRVTTG